MSRRTLREVMRAWALRRRDESIDRVQTARALVLARRRGEDGTVGTVLEGQLDVYRLERRLMFWDDLYLRLSPRARGGEIR
jgi:hypothetical protein